MATLASPPYPSTTRAMPGIPNRRSNSGTAARLMRRPPGECLRQILIPQLLLRGCDNFVRLEAKLLLQLLKRRRGSEGLHTNDAARQAHIALPSQSRALLHGDARPDRGR